MTPEEVKALKAEREAEHQERRAKIAEKKKELDNIIARAKKKP